MELIIVAILREIRLQEANTRHNATGNKGMVSPVIAITYLLGLCPYS